MCHAKHNRQDVRAFGAAYNELTRLPPGGRKPPMIISGMMKTLAFHHSTQGKSDRMPELSVQLENIQLKVMALIVPT